jgi:hypothetical protein
VTRLRNLAVIALVIAAPGRAAVVHAQPPSDRPGRVEVSIGSLWIGREPLGSTSANETTGSGGTRALFTTSTDLAGVGGLEGRVGVRVWRGIDVEAEGSYGKPHLKISIAEDVEGAAPLTAVETLRQIMVGAGVVWNVPHLLWRGRLAPFATAGGGYLRQLHANDVLVDTGRYFQVGGGIKVPLVSSSRRLVKGVGARLDGRVIVRSKGVAFDAGRHASPAFGAAVFVGF